MSKACSRRRKQKGKAQEGPSIIRCITERWARIRRCRASPSHLASTARNRLYASFPTSQITLFESLGSKLPIHRRYTERQFLGIPSCCLQGITVRPVPCNYNVIPSVAALSRRCSVTSGCRPVIAQMLPEEKLGALSPEATREGDRYRASDAKPSRKKTDATPEGLLPSAG